MSRLCSVVCLTIFALCAGCAKPEVRLLVPEIPETLRDCPKGPEIAEALDQKGVALLLLDLDAAHHECRTKLRAVNRILIDAQATPGESESN